MYIAGSHTCALLSDTTVKCFGYNSHGQLGVGDFTNRNTPTAVPGLSGIVQLGVGCACRRLHSAAAFRPFVCALTAQRYAHVRTH